VPAHGRPHSIALTLPPLGAVFLKPPPEEEPPFETAEAEIDADADLAADVRAELESALAED
jgi:hypothetical protein